MHINTHLLHLLANWMQRGEFTAAFPNSFRHRAGATYKRYLSALQIGNKKNEALLSK